MIKKREFVLSAFIFIGFGLVILRLADIMLINHEWYKQKARIQQFKKEPIPVKRGIIYDRKGRELAVNIDTESIFVNPSEIISQEVALSALSGFSNYKKDDLLKKINKNKRFFWIQRHSDLDSVKKIKELGIKGIGFMPETKRYYPKGRLASHIIGYVDIDNKGLEGIEKRYEKYLSAQQESEFVIRDAKGNILSRGIKEAVMGNNIVLTIDEGLQFIVEKYIDEAMEYWKASSASAIMMNPFTGEIMAMASRPTYDPNMPSKAKAEFRRNRALTDCYEPGSTFKIIVSTAALEEGKVTPDTKFDCSPGYIEVAGRRIKDVHKYGLLTFREVIQKSSNVGAIKIGQLIGGQKIYEYVNRFGFGKKTGIDLIGEVSGTVRPFEKWSAMSLGAIPIGYEISVTPLQILRAYSAIANGGYLVKPFVVSEIYSPSGNIIYKKIPETERIISEKTANTMREILKSVTEEGGTAETAAVDGNRVAGKTGTARLLDSRTKRYSTDKYVSSFVGFVPAENPKIAMIVVVHEPKGAIYGGVVAGPVFKKIADEALSYLNVPRDDSKEKGLLLVRNE
jgi:cell division protein FtsI (penicillin-binding protein 3)